MFALCSQDNTRSLLSYIVAYYLQHFDEVDPISTLPFTPGLNKTTGATGLAGNGI